MHFHVHWSIIYNTQDTIWKQPKCFHTHNRLYIYTLYIYVHTHTQQNIIQPLKKKKEILPFVITRMNHIYLHTHTHMQWNIIQPLKRERNPAICDNMDEPRGHYVK